MLRMVRSGLAGVALAGLMVALVIVRPGGAQSPARPPEGLLDGISADSGLFVQLRVADVWKSPVGQSIRAAKVQSIEKFFAYTDGLLGLKPEQVQAINVYLPGELNPGDVGELGITIALSVPLQKERVLTALTLGKLVEEGQLDYQEKGGILTVKIPQLGLARRNEPNQPAPTVTVDWNDPQRIRIQYQLDPQRKWPQVSKTGPLAPVLAEAAEPRLMVFGLNMTKLPAEIRNVEELPAEVRPYAPLIKSDLLRGSASLSTGGVRFEIRAGSENKPILRDAEKSLAALMSLLSSTVQMGQSEFDATKNPKFKPIQEMLTGLAAFFEAVTIRTQGNEAIAQGELKTDLPYGQALAAMLNTEALSQTDRAKLAQSRNNLKQIALALHNYESANGHFPPAAICSRRGKPLLSWRVAILPYIEQDNLYRQFKLDEPWDSEHNLKLANVAIKTFCLPGTDDAKNYTTHYQVFTGKTPAFDLTRPRRIIDFTDGTSNTFLIVTAAKPVPWTKPDDLVFDDAKTNPKELMLFEGPNKVCQVAFADGSVRAIKSTVADSALKGAITRAGGEVIDLD